MPGWLIDNPTPPYDRIAAEPNENIPKCSRAQLTTSTDAGIRFQSFGRCRLRILGYAPSLLRIVELCSIEFTDPQMTFQIVKLSARSTESENYCSPGPAS